MDFVESYKMESKIGKKNVETTRTNSLPRAAVCGAPAHGQRAAPRGVPLLTGDAPLTPFERVLAKQLEMLKIHLTL